MKKLSLCLVLLGVLLFAGCTQKLSGEAAVIDAAREDIPISDIENMDVEIVGRMEQDGKALFWLKTGNEYQAHSYFPVEVEILEEDVYKFSKVHRSAMERGEGAYAFLWHSGEYVFLVDNEDCAYILLRDDKGNEEKIEVTEIPFLYHHNGTPAEYGFYDRNDEEVS